MPYPTLLSIIDSLCRERHSYWLSCSKSSSACSSWSSRKLPRMVRCGHSMSSWMSCRQRGATWHRRSTKLDKGEYQCGVRLAFYALPWYHLCCWGSSVSAPEWLMISSSLPGRLVCHNRLYIICIWQTHALLFRCCGSSRSQQPKSGNVICQWRMHGQHLVLVLAVEGGY